MVQPERSFPLNSGIAFARSVPSSAHVGPAGVAASPIPNRASHPIVRIAASVPVQVFDRNHGEEADTPRPARSLTRASGHLKHRSLAETSISRRERVQTGGPGRPRAPGTAFVRPHSHPIRRADGLILGLPFADALAARADRDEDVRNKGARLRLACTEMERVMSIQERAEPGSRGGTPTGRGCPRTAGDAVGRGGRIDFDGSEDLVDEASEESFPASDPRPGRPRSIEPPGREAEGGMTGIGPRTRECLPGAAISTARRGPVRSFLRIIGMRGGQSPRAGRRTPSPALPEDRGVIIV